MFLNVPLYRRTLKAPPSLTGHGGSRGRDGTRERRGEAARCRFVTLPPCWTRLERHLALLPEADADGGDTATKDASLHSAFSAASATLSSLTDRRRSTATPGNVQRALGPEEIRRASFKCLFTTAVRGGGGGGLRRQRTVRGTRDGTRASHDGLGKRRKETGPSSEEEEEEEEEEGAKEEAAKTGVGGGGGLERECVLGVWRREKRERARGNLRGEAVLMGERRRRLVELPPPLMVGGRRVAF
ncbi:hypothetical protein EYF80_058549 [Liparis tanakae]|uniref:Uncharacterized protein n=1 Tax=Liparis tanakae TaxID=230148 RepID=A0A4Z2ER29_9TELE|nr:hypothetical protein EYF80_058549 [Liparis tanakae]